MMGSGLRAPTTDTKLAHEKTQILGKTGHSLSFRAQRGMTAGPSYFLHSTTLNSTRRSTASLASSAPVPTMFWR